MQGSMNCECECKMEKWASTVNLRSGDGAPAQRHSLLQDFIIPLTLWSDGLSLSILDFGPFIDSEDVDCP